MSKVTVGFCKSKGVEFVEGDVIELGQGESAVISKAITAGSILPSFYDEVEVKSFAWRENTGEQPYDDYMFVEVNLGSQEDTHMRIGMAWHFQWDTSDIAAYRPHLRSLQQEFDEMSDKQETKKALRESYAHAQLEDEAFDREFECYRKMKSAKPEPAPHPELLCPPKTPQSRCAKVDIPSYDNELLSEECVAMDSLQRDTITRLRKERDDLKERCSDLDLQVDSLEAQVSKLKLENVTLKDTVIALKECESIKGQESESAEQKAQREREEAISEIESTLHDRIHFNNSYLPRTIAACLVDNGYRKQT